MATKPRPWKILQDPRNISNRAVAPPTDLIPLYNTLKRIVEIPSAPGFEQGIDRELVEIFKPLCDEVNVDYIGNVYGKKKGNPDGPVIICPAHIDSVSFIVESIEPSGYLRFANLGLIPPYLSYGQRMLIITPKGPVTGCVGTQPGHSHFNYGGAEGKYYPPELIKIPAIDDQFIDVGASCVQDVYDMGIAPGQQIVYDRDLQWLGDGSTGMVTCRGLDDKVGVLVLIESLRLLQGKNIYPTVYMVGASQEEIGSRGASIAGNYLDADLCIGVDGSISEAGPQTDGGTGIGTSPNITRSEIPATIGRGVYISINDIEYSSLGGVMGNPAINQRMIELCEERGIIYQLEANMPYITTDAAMVQYTGYGGTPSVCLKMPMRYTHGPVETGSLFDAQQAALLLSAFLESMTKDNFSLQFVDIPEADKGCKKNRKGF
ncbi:MAG: hypothetical protein LBG12_10710 [Synergistaceae bacterium]|jgi:endoglucanase|nr:hypothetical protein [Synergistaceae bacterium]